MSEELQQALLEFWDYYWDHTGIFDNVDDQRYSLLNNEDQARLDELGAKVETLVIEEEGSGGHRCPFSK